MKKQAKYLILIMVLLMTVMVSCEKFSGSNDSLTGAWRCREESGNNGYTQFTVTIDRLDPDTTMFKIFNFHNLGFETEVYFKLHDSTATIIGSLDGAYGISGKGIVKKDLSSINWEYSISGDFVRAYYFRK